MATQLLEEKSIAADKDLVFKAGEHGYDKFRIPAVIKAPNGHLLAFAEGRRGTPPNKLDLGDHFNVDLVMKKSLDNGKSWGNLVSIWGHQFSDWTTFGNPCPVVDEDTGTIFLAFCEDNFEVWITKSTDNGNNWATPSKISDQVKNPKWAFRESRPKNENEDPDKEDDRDKEKEEERIIWTGPGIGIQIKGGKYKGRLVIPCHFQIFPDKKPPGKDVHNNRMWVFYSDDHGKTWKYPNSSVLGNESQVVELSNHDLMLNGRNQKDKDLKGESNQLIFRRIATSSNGGVTFTESVVDDELIEPICQASILRYSFGSGDNNIILFSNPANVRYREKPSERERMTVRISHDDGKTWPISRLISKKLESSGYSCKKLEFSGYSCLVRQADDNIGLLYEYGKKEKLQIKYARFNLEWLKERNTILLANWDNLSGWSRSKKNDSDISMNPEGQLRLFDERDSVTKVYRSDKVIPCDYTIEFKAKVSQYTAKNKISLGVKVQNTAYRLMFQRKEDGFYALDSTNQWIRLRKTSLYTGWADYKIVVNNGKASLSARVSGTDDYNSIGNWKLQPYRQPDLIEHWVRGQSGQPAEVRFDWTHIYT